MSTIGVLTCSYPRWPGDYAGVFVRERVRSLVAQGHAVEIVAAGAHGAAACDPVLGTPIHRVAHDDAGGAPLFYGAGAPDALEAAPARTLPQALRFWAGMVAATRARVHAWDAVESHWLAPCGIVASLASPARPHRAHAHGGDVALLERLPGGDVLARRLARACDEIVFASADLRRRFLARAACAPGAVTARLTIEAAPLALDDRVTGDARLPRPVRQRISRTILGVGRLVRQKGYDLLVRAAGRLPARRRPRIVLLGDGPERGSLARLAAARGVELELPGFLPTGAVPAYLDAADLFVHPARAIGTRTEGAPLAVREAVRARLPVLAAATGGIPALAVGESSIALFPADDVAALTARLAEFFCYD